MNEQPPKGDKESYTTQESGKGGPLARLAVTGRPTARLPGSTRTIRMNSGVPPLSTEMPERRVSGGAPSQATQVVTVQTIEPTKPPELPSQATNATPTTRGINFFAKVTRVTNWFIPRLTRSQAAPARTVEKKHIPIERLLDAGDFNNLIERLKLGDFGVVGPRAASTLQATLERAVSGTTSAHKEHGEDGATIIQAAEIALKSHLREELADIDFGDDQDLRREVELKITNLALQQFRTELRSQEIIVDEAALAKARAQELIRQALSKTTLEAPTQPFEGEVWKDTQPLLSGAEGTRTDDLSTISDPLSRPALSTTLEPSSVDPTTLVSNRSDENGEVIDGGDLVKVVNNPPATMPTLVDGVTLDLADDTGNGNLAQARPIPNGDDIPTLGEDSVISADAVQVIAPAVIPDLSDAANTPDNPNIIVSPETAKLSAFLDTHGVPYATQEVRTDENLTTQLAGVDMAAIESLPPMMRQSDQTEGAAPQGDAPTAAQEETGKQSDRAASEEGGTQAAEIPTITEAAPFEHTPTEPDELELPQEASSPFLDTVQTLPSGDVSVPENLNATNAVLPDNASPVPVTLGSEQANDTPHYDLVPVEQAVGTSVSHEVRDTSLTSPMTLELLGAKTIDEFMLQTKTSILDSDHERLAAFNTIEEALRTEADASQTEEVLAEPVTRLLWGNVDLIKKFLLLYREAKDRAFDDAAKNLFNPADSLDEKLADQDRDALLAMTDITPFLLKLKQENHRATYVGKSIVALEEQLLLVVKPEDELEFRKKLSRLVKELLPGHKDDVVEKCLQLIQEKRTFYAQNEDARLAALKEKERISTPRTRVGLLTPRESSPTVENVPAWRKPFAKLASLKNRHLEAMRRKSAEMDPNSIQGRFFNRVEKLGDAWGEFPPRVRIGLSASVVGMGVFGGAYLGAVAVSLISVTYATANISAVYAKMRKKAEEEKEVYTISKYETALHAAVSYFALAGILAEVPAQEYLDRVYEAMKENTPEPIKEALNGALEAGKEGIKSIWGLLQKATESLTQGGSAPTVLPPPETASAVPSTQPQVPSAPPSPPPPPVAVTEVPQAEAPATTPTTPQLNQQETLSLEEQQAVQAETKRLNEQPITERIDQTPSNPIQITNPDDDPLIEERKSTVRHIIDSKGALVKALIPGLEPDFLVAHAGESITQVLGSVDESQKAAINKFVDTAAVHYGTRNADGLQGQTLAQLMEKVIPA